MLLRILKIAVPLSFLSILNGCVGIPSYRPDLPDDIGDKGLVVGQVVGIGRLYGWSLYTDVVINNRKRGKVVNGFIAIPMSAGDYSLDSLYSETSAGSSYYGGVTVTRRKTATLPLKRTFTVQPKRVTNLGLLVLYPDPSDKQRKKFLRMFVDNTQDMKYFLKSSYPLLAQKLNSDTITLAPGELMSGNVLKSLRKEIAAKAAAGSRGNATYVTGFVGTLAEVRRNRSGRVSGVRVIDVPTYSSIQSHTPNFVKNRFAFLTTTNRLFFVRNGKAVEKRPPPGLRAAKIYALGASDLVIIDDKLEIYTSTNNGNRWHAYLGLARKNKVDAKITAGANGYYIYTVKSPSVLFSKYGKTDFSPVALPPDAKTLGLLHEKPAGLFAEREITFYRETKKRPFYFRPAGKPSWESRSMPGTNCGHFAFLDRQGRKLGTTCGDRAVGFPGPRDHYVSRDGGKTWQKK